MTSNQRKKIGRCFINNTSIDEVLRGVYVGAFFDSTKSKFLNRAKKIRFSGIFLLPSFKILGATWEVMFQNQRFPVLLSSVHMDTSFSTMTKL